MKSGPTLNACMVKPRRRNASSSPSVIVVLPTPLDTPAMTSTRAESGTGPVHSRRLERRHLGVDLRGGARQMNEDGGARSLTEAHAEVEVRRQAEVPERDRMPRLDRAMRRHQVMPRGWGDRGRD